MNANTLQDFRAMQLAVKGASTNASFLLLEGSDCIFIGDKIEIREVSLENDSVVVYINDIASYMPIQNLSDCLIEELITILREKALLISGRDVMVNDKGEIVL